ELLTINYCRTFKIPFKIVRYHNVYGVRMGYDHVLPEFFKRVYEKVNPFPIYGGEETRAFCSVEDAVKATELVMLGEKCDGEIIHIGNSSQEIKIINLLKLVLEIANYHPKIEVKPAPAGCVMRRCPNTDKLFKLTGFKAEKTLEKTLPKMFNWYVKRFGEV
ncbi:MAG: NAD-dependent epimerase/dehydratase family protein, partial [Selenomonadaceae bacterium]|nr:NAD-dependent epimerase/dehydratase family protein [Selenomonadaceae bacterium]